MPALSAPVFAPSVSYPLGGGYRPIGLAAGDVDGDGKLDLLTANSFARTLSFLHGNGDGTFSAPVQIVVGLFPMTLALADFNNDGKLDVVAARDGAISCIDPCTVNDSDLVIVRLGNGDGTFGPIHSFWTHHYPQEVVAADLNGDGKQDLALATADGPPYHVTLFLGHGDGTFDPPVDLPTSQPQTSVPYAVAMGDLDGDGIPDLMTAENQLSSVWLGLGGGTFSTGTFAVLYSTGTWNLGLSDLDGDGHLDVVVPSRYGGAILSARGHGDGTFDPARSFAEPAPMSVAVGDLDVDGVPDVVTTEQSGGLVDSVSVRPGLGDGGFGPRTTFPVGAYPQFVLVRDLDGDGRPDIAVTNYYSSSVSVLLNRTTVSTPPGSLPARLELSLAGANPARSAPTFELAIPVSTVVHLEVCDVQGRHIATLQDGPLPRGRYTRTWDGSTPAGGAPAGLYWVRLRAPGVALARKVVLAH